MKASVENTAEKPRIFISYARSDSSALAQELAAGLRLVGFEPYLDRRDIVAAEDWEARLGGLIQSADTVVFILSPAAVKSARCAWEVDRANALGKRIIPVQAEMVPEAAVPERLRRLQYILFRKRGSFARPLGELAATLRQDVVWIREHTRLGEAAARWQAKTEAGEKGADDLLLRGGELADANIWEKQRKADAPEIMPTVTAFLAASKDMAVAAQNQERKRLVERERLVADKERVQRRSFFLLSGLLLGVLAGLWTVFLGWQELMVNRSQFLAGIIDQVESRSSYVDGMLLGLEALPDEQSASLRQRALPLEQSAQNALDNAWRRWSSGWGERTILAGHTASVESAFSPNGARILTWSSDNR
jgi:hypothetical protein